MSLSLKVVLLSSFRSGCDSLPKSIGQGNCEVNLELAASRSKLTDDELRNDKHCHGPNQKRPDYEELYGIELTQISRRQSVLSVFR